MSASLAEMAAEPFVLCTGADLRARRPGPVVEPIHERVPAPTSGIRLVVATVKALGRNATSNSIVARAGISQGDVDTLLLAAVDVGLLTRVRRGRRFVYRPATLRPPATSGSTS